MSYYDKPSEADLIAELPSALNVYLDGSSEPQTIPVSWKSIGDFDTTSFFYYEFDPVWDTDSYDLADDIDLPYIGVWLDSSDGISLMAADNASSSN